MTPSYQMLVGDCIDMMRTLPDQSVQCCVTSPPYFGLRDYGVDGQIGLEQTPADFIGRLVEVFHEVRRVLRDDGTAWVNMGDSYTARSTGNLSFRRDGAAVSPDRAPLSEGIKVKGMN